MAAMTPARKRIAWLIVAIGGAMLVERVIALSGDDEAAVSAPVRHARAGTSSDRETVSITPPAALQLQRLDARFAASGVEAGASAVAETNSLFEAVSWVPPAPKVAPAPPPPPVAPPFPYAYMGGLAEDGVRTAIFVQGDRSLPLKTGDTVDATWRVEQINDRQMTVTYIPMQQTVNVPLGGAR